jgi:hypothetical protein
MNDVTERCVFGENDGETLPLLECVCGMAYEPWDFAIGIYPESPKKCQKCGRKFHFAIQTRIFAED